MQGTFIIVGKDSGKAIASVNAPENTPSSEVCEKFVIGQGLDRSVADKFRADWFPTINWFGSLADVDTAFCDLAGKFYVGTSEDQRDGFISGPHDEEPELKTGQFLFRRSEDGEKFIFLHGYECASCQD